jgi:hypothetical protein
MTAGENPHGHGRPSLAAGAVRLLAREASRAPLVAITLGLQAWERSRAFRDAVRRHGDGVLQLAAHTPIGRFLPQPEIDDDAESEAQRIAAVARETTIRVATPPERRAPAPATPPAPSPAAKAVGAPGAVTDTVEKVSQQLAIAEPTSRDELPIPDFDNVSLASLRARLRSLTIEQLVTLREWEQAHAHRLPVVTLLDNRIAKLAADQGGQRA